MNINYSLFTLLIPLLVQISPCSGTAKLMVRFDSFDNPGFLKENGECCDGERRNGICTGNCDYSVRVCLSRNASGDPCELESFDVGSVAVVTSSFTFPRTFDSGFANPVPISLNSWQGDVIVTVNIYDEDTEREERVDSFNLTYTRFTPVSNRALLSDDFLPYTLIGRRQQEPTTLQIAVTAACDRYFYGDECLVNCVENDDCNGHYTCEPVTGAKICNEGWTGDNCSISASPDHGCLTSQVCENNAECIKYGNRPTEYYCCCAPGFTGTLCDQDIDECASNPCQNGASCLQERPNSYTCVCPIRFKGEKCEIQRNCDDDPCENGGECRSVVGSFFCLCDNSYTGETCETLITTTQPTTTPACPPDFYGPDCSVFCQAQDDCTGHYTCDSVSGNKLCNPTWGGVNCSISTFDDPNCQCVNGGQCFEGQCCCPEQFTGSRCETRLFCRDDSCSNGGQCYEESNGFRCACREGFIGRNCENAVRTCPDNFYGPLCAVFCRSQEDCTGGQWSCDPMTGQRQCRFGWRGPSCSERDPSAIHRTPCPDSQCRNGGVCANSTCCCPIGYTGSLCHVEILECSSNPCQNNARCEDLIGDYQCFCPPEFTGKNCEYYLGLEGRTTTQAPDLCVNVNCLNGGTCIGNSSTTAICLCLDRFTGDRCQTSARATTPGQNQCPPNFYGPTCQTFCIEEDSCERGHFYCDAATGRRLCRNGWIGDICNTRAVLPIYDPECPSMGCKNRGQCFNGSCCCLPNTQGKFCQEDLLPCDAQPCQNGGQCQDLVSGYSCECPSGFTGRNCESVFITTPATTSTTTGDLEACQQERCQNGGVCIPTLLPFSCYCLNASFAGQYCEINIASTPSSSYRKTIYFLGNISDNNQGAIQQILQRAETATASSSSCCLIVNIVEKRNYIDQAGNAVVGYVYTVTHSTDGNITPGPIPDLYREVNSDLQNTAPFDRDGVFVYTGLMQQLANLDLVYSVDIIGTLPESRRQSVIQDIETAWRTANPNCGCQFSVNIASSQEYAGEYGMTVSRVFYTIKRDNEPLEPASTQAPSRGVFVNLARSGGANSVYQGTFLLPYNQHHELLLNRLVDVNSEEWSNIREAIRLAWTQWKNTNPSVPENIRNTIVDVVMLRPKVFYTQEGIRLTKLMYFVVLNNTIIIGPQPGGVTVSSPLVCEGCTAIPLPYVDIKGPATRQQIINLGANLNPSDPSGSSVETEQFVNSNGEPVIRVYYQPPISEPDVTSTTVSQQRLDLILNMLGLEQPTLPTERTYAVTFAGSITESDKDVIEELLTNAWVNTYGIPAERIRINITSDGTFTSSTGTGQLTQIRYSVSVQGGDSQWTRFGGLDLETLRQYFITPDLVVVGGAGTLAPLQTTTAFTSSAVSSVTTATPTGVTSTVETISVVGNITDANQGLLEEVLQTALNRSRTGSPCCVTLYIVEKTYYAGPSGEVITGLRYNITGTDGASVTLTDSQRQNFTAEIQNGLQTVDVFRQGGVVIYTGAVSTPTYSVDFVGDLPDSRRPAVLAFLEAAWNRAYPGCNCRFVPTILTTQEYSGEYGIKITRISYTMTRDGQLQNPDTVPPPSRGVFITSAQGDVLVNSVYSGSILYPANQRHSALLTGVVDVQGSEGQFVRDAIKQAWEQFRQDSQALPPGLQNAPLEIILLRPQPYYTSDGKELTNVEYLVVLNGRVILGPQVANVSLTNPLFCTGCTAVPVPFVDIQGTLASEQLAVLGRNLNPSDPDGKTVSSESFTNANGDHITRIYYRPPFTDPTSQTTALSEESLQNILTRLNLQRPTLLTEKTFTLNFDGKLNDNNIDVIENTITDAWASTYNIPQNAISVKVNSINNNFISQSSNTPATEVTYTVSVLGADSQWTSFNDIRPSTIGRFFTNTGLVTITGEVITTNPGETTTTLPTSSTTEPFLIDTIFIRGNISNTLQSQVEEILRSSLNKSTEGVPCCYTLRILDKVTFLDQNGNVVEGYRYNVSNTTGSPVTSFSQLQTLLFETEVQNELRSSGVFTQLGSVLYVGEVDTLTPITFTYTVDFIGDIPYTWRDAIIADIETAWQTANQDCNCEFSGNIVYILKFTGDYGLTVSRVFYSMTRDGRTQNPVQTQAPAWDIVAGLVRGDNRVNPLYSGSVLLSDRLAHSVLLNNVVDMQSTLGNDITNAIEAAWINWRDTNQAVPPSLRRGTLDIVLKRPQMYYTPDGRQLTYLEYFVLLNGTSIIGPEGTNVPLNGQYFCDGCTAVPVPYVEVQGSLSPEQLQTLISNLNPTSRTTTPVISERFVNTLGDDITRVYYQPPISATDGQPTLLSPQRIAQTLTNLGLQEASLPKQKTFTINLAGNDQANNANRVQQVLRASWASSLNIPLDDLTVTVVSMDDDFVSSSGPVTRVNYRVTIQNGDSHWTRYAGIPLESLQQYLQASSLVVVTGVIQPSGGSTPGSMTGTTVTATTPSVVSGPTDASPTTPTTGSTNTIYIIDNSGAQNETVVEEVLQTALNRTRTGSTCCLTVHVIEWTQYVDNKTSDTIIGYTYNVTNGTQPVTLTPGEVTNIQNEVTKVVVTDPFINFGYVLYTGTVTGLKNVSFTYSVDLVGDVPEWQRQNVIREIQRVWQEANPDCQCVYTVSIEHIADYSGDYGSPVSRVYYTVKRDDQYQDPAVDPAPSRSQFRSTLQEGNSLRALYRGSVLYPYNKRHSILLNSVISLDSDQGIRIQNNVRDAWINWRNTDPSVPNDKRNAPIEIIFLKPETFYTQDGRTLTSFEYLVLLDNTELIGPERANISLTGPDFCQNCVAVVVPYVDIDGTPTTEQLQGLGFNLNPTDPSGTTLSSEVFMDPNNAQVTRVFYRPPISGPDVQSTAISEPRLTQILSTFNLKQSIQPVKKTYTLDFAGSVGDNFKTSVEQTIRDVWSDEYGLAPELISVDINKIDDNFISTPSNNKVTKMEYTVSVNGIDSHWTRFEGVDIDTLTPYFTQRELTLVTGEVITIGEVTPPTTPPVMTQVIYIRGNDSTNTADRVEEILQTAVNNTKNGSTCCFTVHVIEWTSYIDSNTGDNVVGYTYNVTNGTEPVILTPDEVTNVQNEVTKVVVTDPFINLGYVLYTGTVTDLKNVSFTYSVDLVGDVPEWQRPNVIREIQRVWQEANPGCQCTYTVSIRFIEGFIGDYGTQVSRIYYTVKRDDQYQDPATDQAPSRSQFSSTLQEGNSPRALYRGSVLYPYNKRHSILLNSVTSLDSDQGIRIQNNIRDAWINWRNTDPSVPDALRSASIDIINLRPQTYYTPDGRTMTSFEYLVLLDDTELIGPQRANISLTGPDFCQNCVAVVIPYVDIDGTLTPEQREGFGYIVNPLDPTGSTLSSEVFINGDSSRVTRVYYQPPITSPDVQSTEFSEPRLSNILRTFNLTQPSDPMEKLYTIYLSGTIGDNARDNIELTILNAWSELYGVPVADLSVNISDINDKFVITPSNDPVTRVRYTVAVEEVDSHLTRFEGADTATLSTYFTDSTLTLIQGQIIDKEETTPPFQGLPFFSEVIYIRGNVSESDKGMVEEILQKALNTTKYGASCCITVDVYSNSPYIDQNGNIVVGYQFNVSNSTGGPVTSLTSQENRTFTAEVNKELQTSDLFTRYGSVIYTGPFTDLKYIDFAYTVELIGDIPDQQRRALIADIEQAWKTANPDCQCLYKANIITMPKYSGEYGILLHRVYYTITRDGRIQDPATTPAPAHGVFKTTMEGSVNAVYSGAYLLPYNLRQSVKLIGDIDLYSTQGQQVQRAVMNAWINWRNVHHEVPEMLRTGTMEIQYLRPIRYYTENQQIVTQLDYFLILNGSVIAPTHVPVINSQYVCDECEAIPVPFADVKGQLTTNKLQELNARLGGIGGSAAAVYVEEFVDSKEEPVSRVYYQSTALPPEQLTAILTAQGLQQPTPPTSRAFYVYFEGSVSSDQNAIIEETIKNNWSGTYSIPQSVLQVDVINIDDRYVSSTNNQQVTRATYTVTIQGADSVWTKFKGLEPGTLAQVFREVPGLVVVTGNVIYTDFISTTPGTASPTFPSETSSTIQTLYFRGNISDSNAGSVQAILQGAFNDTVNGASCCVMVYLIEKTTYIDNAGSVLVGYSYNLTNITGGPVEAMAPEQTDVFRKDVNSRLQSTEPFRQTGVVLYTGSLQGFRVADLAYYVDFVGDMPPRPTTKSLIDQVWRNANQDCGCELSAEILLTVPMSGDYGIKVYRVYYTVKRDGQVQSPSVVNPPERSAFATATVSDKSLNPLYMGSTLIPYNQRHSVLLNRVVDITGSQGTDVQQALLAAWISWLNNNPNFPEGISTADIDILLLRPVTYYTQAGTQNSMVDYFVVVRGQLIGPGQGPTLTGPLFCKCSALPVPFVDVKGTLHWSQLLQLGTALNPEDTTGTSLNREMFIDANGEPVTRVFYAPTITGSDVTTTAVEPDKLNVILSTQNLERPDILIQKTFTFNFAGSLGDEYKEAITEGIVNAWSGSFVIPQEDITVDIVNIDTNYYSNDGGGKVTQVTYTVSILEADSSWSRFEGMNTEDLDQFFQTESPDVKVCGCSARPGREILVVGTVGNDTSELAAALVTAWNEANPAFTGTLAVGIQQVEGSTPSTLKYTVIPENGPTAFVDGDLTPPSDEMLNSKFSPLDLTVYKAENDDDSSTLAWAIPLGIILALLLLLLIILIIFCCIRSRRRKHVETIEHDAAKFQERGYDKEHFTTQPVYFENEAYGESHGFYAVNGDETGRGGILNGKSAGHSKKENIKMVNYQESKDEMSVKSAALLDAGNDLLLPISATSSRSFTLNVDGGATAASASTEDCERKIREAWSNVYGPMAGDLKVQMDTMEAASSSMGYTISGNGESCEEIIQTADHSKIEAYLASTGFIRNERETTLNTDSTANKGHYSSEISFNVPATTSTTSTLQSGSTIIEAEVLPKNQHANHSESFESGITFTVPATSASSAASSVTTGGAQSLEDTVYFRGSISDNYQPLVESLLQSSWNKATDDFSSYKVKVEDKTEHTDRFGEPVNGYRYSVKKSGGGQVPELSAEQAQTFTNHITIELHNTNVFKQDEVVLYSGSAHDLKLVRASSSDEVIFTSLEPTNGGGSSFEQTSTTVSTLEPTNGEGSSFEQTSTTVSSLEPTRTIVTSLEPNDNKLPSLGETLWVSSGAQDGLETVSQEMKTESGSFMTEHFVSSSGHTESKTVESFSTSQVQETSFHREQFSTQVFHIQKDVFAESHGLHVVHNEHTDKEHV